MKGYFMRRLFKENLAHEINTGQIKLTSLACEMNKGQIEA